MEIMDCMNAYRKKFVDNADFENKYSKKIKKFIFSHLASRFRLKKRKSTG